MYVIELYCRFGEEKAVGWAVVMEKRQQMEFPEAILGELLKHFDVYVTLIDLLLRIY